MGKKNNSSPSSQGSGAFNFVSATLASLTPFFISTFLYFYIWEQTPGTLNAVIKVLPIYSLIFFVLKRSHDGIKFKNWILLGLAVSSFGDIFMVWRSQLVNGMAAFALAQLCYIKAFGFKPLKLNIGALLFLGTIGALLMLIPGLKHDQFLLMGLPVYCALLTTMAWRANARYFAEDRTCKYIRICTAVGSISFLLSDMVIGFDRFYSPIDDAQLYIMATYYLAQVGIALSAGEPKSCKGKRQ